MQQGLAKAATIKQSGDWKKKSAEEEQIIALRAEVDTLAGKNAALSKKFNKSGNKDQKQGEKSGNNKKKDKKKNDKSNEKGKDRPLRDEDKWKVDKSLASGKETFEKDGKTYWWCPYHHKSGMWSRHKGIECSRKNSNVKSVEKNPTSTEDSKAAKALAALMEDSDEDSE